MDRSKVFLSIQLLIYCFPRIEKGILRLCLQRLFSQRKQKTISNQISFTHFIIIIGQICTVGNIKSFTIVLNSRLWDIKQRPDEFLPSEQMMRSLFLHSKKAFYSTTTKQIKEGSFDSICEIMSCHKN